MGLTAYTLVSLRTSPKSSGETTRDIITKKPLSFAVPMHRQGKWLMSNTRLTQTSEEVVE